VITGNAKEVPPRDHQQKLVNDQLAHSRLRHREHLGGYGLVVVIGWIGALKFANFEAHQIQPLVANSPCMGWLYNIFPVYTFSALLGVFELAAAVWSRSTNRAKAFDRGQRAGSRAVRLDNQLPVHHAGSERASGRRIPCAVAHR
jgi:Protein of unknown function, DUF417